MKILFLLLFFLFKILCNIFNNVININILIIKKNYILIKFYYNLFSLSAINSLVKNIHQAVNYPCFKIFTQKFKNYALTNNKKNMEFE